LLSSQDIQVRNTLFANYMGWMCTL
jgi:hypothetical protein